MVMNINTAGLAEGLGLADALGLDLTMVREVFSQTGANSRVLQTDGEDMQKRDHSCFFSASHAAKDSGIALQLAKKEKLTVPLATATKKQFDKMVSEGDVKFWGTATEVTDHDTLVRFADAIFESVGYRFEVGTFDAFDLDLLGASSVMVDKDTLYVRIWTPGNGVRVVEKK